MSFLTYFIDFIMLLFNVWLNLLCFLSLCFLIYEIWQNPAKKARYRHQYAQPYNWGLCCYSKYRASHKSCSYDSGRNRKCCCCVCLLSLQTVYFVHACLKIALQACQFDLIHNLPVSFHLNLYLFTCSLAVSYTHLNRSKCFPCMVLRRHSRLSWNR